MVPALAWPLQQEAFRSVDLRTQAGSSWSRVVRKHSMHRGLSWTAKFASMSALDVLEALQPKIRFTRTPKMALFFSREA